MAVYIFKMFNEISAIKKNMEKYKAQTDDAIKNVLTELKQVSRVVYKYILIFTMKSLSGMNFIFGQLKLLSFLQMTSTIMSAVQLMANITKQLFLVGL
jgi:hypothetical protein